MKRPFLFLAILMAFGMTVPAARADSVYKPSPGDNVQALPGNAYIITNPDRNRTIRIDDERSILYRALLGKNYPQHLAPAQGASLNDVNQLCGGVSSVSQKNRCIRDVIRAREKLNKRYND